MIDKSFGVIPVSKSNNQYLFLLVHHNAGHWAFPKGHPRGGETEIQTALRELKEETNIKDCNIKEDIFFTEHYSYEEQNQMINKTVKYFLGFIDVISEIKIKKGEIQNYKWESFEEALNLITFNESKKILQQVKNHLL